MRTDSQPHSRLRAAALALAFAMLAACAGTAPRADAPIGPSTPAAPHAAVAPAVAADPATVVDPAAGTADVDTVSASGSSIDSAAAAASGDGFEANGTIPNAPTEAELDYAALYGTQVYDPIADPTLPAPAQLPGASADPWEGWNRRVHAFNMAIDRTVAEPLARAYMKVAPRPVRLGVGNFFNNLGQPVSALNALLQGKPKQAGQSLGRFLVNATLGVAGLFDPASRMNIPNRSEDFGQTLGVWGWEKSRFVELPLFGPRTVRDVFGLVGDGQVSPLRQVDDDTVRIGLQGLQLVDLRTQLFAVDRLREGAEDEYALVRDAWMQRRNYQIHGDRIRQDQDGLPDYLLDDEANPTVPVDVMPIIPGSSPN
ncbi:MlaA family lipoprotein [Luteimonas sp. MJ246]|uniref:MlaA family lipoprotein n=1 Tax=Luteimonas sp. MJ174 TaxID=3129237 RepID=UPI0031BAFDA7